MAIRCDYTDPKNNATYKCAYINVKTEEVKVVKSDESGEEYEELMQKITACVYASEADRTNRIGPITTKIFGTPFTGGEPYAHAYAYLKTLSNFAGAVDQ